MKLKILSDTHQFHLDELQTKVDLLIHCGDATNYREEYSNERRYFCDWWLDYPAEYKVYVPGNRDSFLDSTPQGRVLEVKDGKALIDGSIKNGMWNKGLIYSGKEVEFI